MNVTIEDISSVKKKLSFEVAAETVDVEIEKAYQKITKTAKIKGFRPGKAPRSVVEKYYAPQMEEQVLGRLINDSYFKALVEHRVAAITDPEIVESSPLQKGQIFTYQAHVEIKPEVEIKNYTGLTLQKEKFEADPKVIDDRLDEMVAGRAHLQTTDRDAAQKGDHVVIDFEGFVDKVAFEGGKAEGHQLELGSGSFIPGFEEQLEGMTRGEERAIEVTFPEAYGNKELAGKPAVFNVRLHEIKENVAPELNDDFAKGFGLESLQELREKLDENYRTQEQNRIDGDLRERLIAVLIERNPMEVPEAMVVSQLDYMLGNIRNRLKQQGMSLEMMGMNEESFKQMYRETAVSQVKGSLVMEAVARQENIKADPSEIDDKLEEIAKMSNAPLDAVKKHYAPEEARRGLLAQVAEEKVMQFLLDHSTVEEVTKDQLAASGQDRSKE
ncbi:MAG: trigger factor [Desulfuromonadaceae bacterium GWC2_58_13]|nr:MAG: trigger factor [Desulfuromonadaceae bacterium GWC2_58_13]